MLVLRFFCSFSFFFILSFSVSAAADKHAELRKLLPGALASANNTKVEYGKAVSTYCSSFVPGKSPQLAFSPYGRKGFNIIFSYSHTASFVLRVVGYRVPFPRGFDKTICAFMFESYTSDKSYYYAVDEAFKKYILENKTLIEK